jgi:hypothetical protein
MRLNIRGVFAFLILASIGCGPQFKVHPDKAVVDSVKSHIEGVSWNEEGRVISLDLTGSEIESKDIERIANLVSLNELALNGATVENESLGHLKRIPNLHSLSLSGSTVSDDSFAALKGMSSIRLLDLTNTRISDKSIETLATMTQLRTIFIKGTSFSESGIKELKQRKPECRIQER